MAFDFQEYLGSFNTTDEATFVERFYTDDFALEGPFGRLEGRDKWLAILNDTHVGIKEELEALTVVREGDTIMAETVGTFTATADRPDFAHGALKAGESVSVRFFTIYRIRGDQIAEMTIAWWDAGMRPGRD
ncbi:MAG TPA: nuclear transport factor 2 family protein [Allosphingosinicella sp.]|nr:nuclear transport factor 2 family protein [Allosphingosinicella sp.]